MNIYVLLGKSSTGKDTICNALLKSTNLNSIVSYTTRPPRPGEVNHKDYHFTTKEHFKELILNDSLIEYRTYNTLVDNKQDVWYYGITKNEITKDSIVILDITGLEGFLRYFRREDVNIISIFIFTPDDIREKRAKSRPGFDKTEWDRRLLDDNKVFKNIHEIVDYEVPNFYSENAVEHIKRIIKERTENEL